MDQQFTLTQWQKKQASLLYYFSSMDYLIGLRDQVNDLKLFAEGKISQSRSEGRDSFLHSACWGVRDTTENWSNNAWPFLADFQLSTAQAIADLPSEIYHTTGANQCIRGISEFSMQWATANEEEMFDQILSQVSAYSKNIDYTMQKRFGVSWWDDFCLTKAWLDYSKNFQSIPKFRMLLDITSNTGERPPRTGVYVSIDDPHASLQFAWNGAPGGELIPASTFNDLGLAALSSIGRKRLWTDDMAMRDFVCTNLSNPAFASDPSFEGVPKPSLAAGLVASNAFTSRTTRWCFVEPIKGEFEPVEIEADVNSHPSTMQNIRFGAGEICNTSGYYFTPAHLDSRRQFNAGEAFPDVESSYGKTIWQWDTRQD